MIMFNVCLKKNKKKKKKHLNSMEMCDTKRVRKKMAVCIVL